MFTETVLGLMFAMPAQPAPPIPSPPPIIITPGESRFNTRTPDLAIWEPGEVTCANGQSFPGSAINRPVPTRLRNNIPATLPVTFDFTLAADGRPLDIRQSPTTQASARVSDLAPAIAGSSFVGADIAPDAAKRLACRVTFTESVIPAQEASLEDVLMLRAYDRRSALPLAIWRHFVPGDCDESPRPRPLTRSYVDYRDLPKPAGERDWTIVSYGTDGDGNAINVEIVASSDSAELNDEAVRAVSQWRSTQGNRSGCMSRFWTAAGTVKAPAAPPLDSYGEEPDACNAKGKWAREARNVYPETFRRRGIEGWAVLRFDVAPWGEIGNIEVLEAQPAESLGPMAANMLRGSSFVEQESGLRGCITRVGFSLPESRASEETPASER